VAVCAALALAVVFLLVREHSGAGSHADPTSGDARRALTRSTPEASAERIAASSGTSAQYRDELEAEIESRWAALRDAMGKGSPLQSAALSVTGSPGSRDKWESAIDRYYAETTDREIIEELVEQTHYTREELERVKDLRAFLKRNAQVLLGGLGLDAELSELGQFQSEIAFSRRVDVDNTARLAQTEFGPETRKLYAVFSSAGLPVDEVTVVWRDLDRQKILIYQRYPIEATQENSFVWFRQPEAWPAGEYAVEIYTGDEAMEPIAVGSYSVTSN
jgi:hypothetical protein